MAVRYLLDTDICIYIRRELLYGAARSQHAAFAREKLNDIAVRIKAQSGQTIAATAHPGYA
jgi:hypothetical protein